MRWHAPGTSYHSMAHQLEYSYVKTYIPSALLQYVPKVLEQKTCLDTDPFASRRVQMFNFL